MRMLGKRTHDSTLECPYGCCRNPLNYTAKGRRKLKRSVKRSERAEALREAREDADL